jgi:hypothetical protein
MCPYISFIAVTVIALLALSCQKTAEKTVVVVKAPPVRSDAPAAPAQVAGTTLASPAITQIAEAPNGVAVNDYITWLVSFDQQAMQSVSKSSLSQPSQTGSGVLTAQAMFQEISNATRQIRANFEEKVPQQECRTVADQYRKLIEARFNEMTAMAQVGEVCVGDALSSPACAEAMGRSSASADTFQSEGSAAREAIFTEVSRLKTTYPTLNLPDFMPFL